MQSNHAKDELNSADRELESALAVLKPASARIDARDIALVAMRRDMCRRIWIYRAIAACLAAGLGLALLNPPRRIVRETQRTVNMHIPASTVPAGQSASAELRAATIRGALLEDLQIQEAMFEKGLSALPAPQMDRHQPAPSKPKDLDAIFSGDSL